MDSEFVSTLKRTLEIQGFGRPAEHVPYSKQNNMTDKSCLDNNYNNDYDE
jgi:hypothetical protein